MPSTSRRPWHEVRRDTASLPELLHVLRGRRLLVLGAVLMLAGVALLLGLFRGPAYTAEAVVVFGPREALEDEATRQAFAREAFSEVTSSATFLQNVKAEAGWNGEPEEFRYRIDPGTFASRDGSMGLSVSFTGREPGEAVRVANAYAEGFARGVGRLGEEQLSGGTAVADARVVARAEVPQGSGARPLVYAAVAAGAGLLIGGVTALALEGRAGGWRGVRDAEMTLKAPVLGAIPDYSPAENEA